MRVRFAALVAVVAWASVYAVLGIGLSDFPPGESGFLRFAIGTAALGVYMLISRTPLPPRETWRDIALIGVIGFFLYTLLLNFGQQSSGAIVASLIIGATPAVSAAMAAVFLRESVSLRTRTGTAISFFGVSLNAVGASDLGKSSAIAGILLLIGATIARSIHLVLQRKVAKSTTSLQLAFCSMAIGAALFLPWAANSLSILPGASIQAIAALVYLGLFPSAVAYMLWAFVLKNLSVSKASNWLSVIPVLSLAFAVVLTGGYPEDIVVLGALITIVGVAIVQTGRS